MTPEEREEGEAGMTYQQYRRTQIAEMADWHEDFDMTDVSVSAEDAKAGSPKMGDKIARNPANHADRWLVAAAYFAENFEPMTTESLREQMLAIVKGPKVGGICRVCAGTGDPTCVRRRSTAAARRVHGKFAEHCYHCDGVGIQRQFVKAVDAIQALIGEAVKEARAEGRAASDASGWRTR